MVQSDLLKERLQTLILSTGNVAGLNFFEAFMYQLALEFNVQQVMATQILKKDPSQLQTIMVWTRSKRSDNFTYPMIDTPCERVIRTAKPFLCPDQILTHYPTIADLIGCPDIRSYFGAPILNQEGTAVGHICVLDNKAFVEEHHLEAIVTMFIPRAFLELERIQRDENQKETMNKLEICLKKHKIEINLIKEQLDAEINKRQEIEKTANSYQELYHNILDANPIGLIITDLSGIVGEVNLTAHHIYGCGYDQMIGRSVKPLLQSNNYKNFDELVQTINAGGRFHFIGKDCRIDGSPFVVEVFGSSLQYHGKTCILLIIFDLCDRMRMEKEQARLISILEATPDCIGTVDKHGNILFINAGGRKLMGIEKGADVFHCSWDQFHPEWAWRLIQEKGLPKTKEEGVWVGESAILHADGHEIPVSQVIIAHYSQGGDLEYYSTVMRDVTKQKQEEIRQIRVNHLLRILSSTQAQFIADIDPQSIFDQLLQNLLSLTQSDEGFLGEIVCRADGNSFLKMRAITDLFKDRSENLSSQEEPRGIEFYIMKSLLDATKETQKSIIINNLSTNPIGIGFHKNRPELKSFMGIPFLSGDKLVGMAGVANRPNDYDDRLSEYLQPFIVMCSNIIEAYRTDEKRKHAQKQLKKSLTEKEVLLKEIHHRVKNNMQIISSMLRQQSSYVQQEHVRSILQDCQERIRSMALIHEMLYQSKDLAGVDFGEYIRDLVKILVRTYCADFNNVLPPTILAEPVRLNINTAIPVGLIISELISNALKHAFSDKKKGILQVIFKELPGQQLYLEVRDNGKGMQHVDWKKPKSMGLRLIALLTKQIKGKLEHQNHSGTKIKITFNKVNRK